MKPRFNPRHMALGLVVIGLGVAIHQISIPLTASAQKSRCQSNLKQIGLGALQYIRDYDETFMLAPKWVDGVKPYIGQRNASSKNYLLSCPKTERGYAFNVHLGGALITLVKQPQTMALFYEPARTVNADGGKSWSSSGVHDEGSNVCFHDGHVKWVRAKPVFWTTELVDVAGAKRRRDAESRRMIAELKARYNRERKASEAYKKKQRALKPKP